MKNEEIMKQSISAKGTREILRAQWSGLQHIWIFDKRLALLSLSQIKAILDTIYKEHKYKFQDEKFDCDDFGDECFYEIENCFNEIAL